MAKRLDRTILDTNLWISFLITKDFKKLDQKIRTQTVKLIFSTELLEEFFDVVARPKFKKYFDKTDVEQIIDLFEVYGEIVDVKSKIDGCRDKKDNFLLALAKDAKADFLVTGDLDLLELKRFDTTKIVTISEYLGLKSKK